ncbi:MAG: zinc ribbon domain-containing protein [Armatimonadetes bacterium]|nr:zinc ribbon domain-containing protein [Armatimonadota bacterium]NIO75538.1 zinc ribbon domain-containing protein [Armatimonadota bacterium]NIO95915.1 zinc ribbon domain-containing protein [Armatimonadota bacterium]
MPLYEFECDKCSHAFEELCPFGSNRKPPCPVCRSRRVRKIMSAAAVRGDEPSSEGSGSSCGTCSSRSCSTCR